jgi:acetyl-CoA C-acetyltransferase
MVLTGDPITASRAAELGFVNVLVDDPDGVMAAAHTLAQRIVTNAPIAVRKGLTLVNQSVLATDDENWTASYDGLRCAHLLHASCQLGLCLYYASTVG